MPKIIEDLKNRILTAAEEAFVEKGFEQVDMRSLAGELGIAVGTLYNYYRGKGDLYLAVLVNSWEKTFSSLIRISRGSGTRDEKLTALLRTLAQDITQRRGLGEQVQYLRISKEEQRSILESSIMAPLSEILQETFSFRGESACLKGCTVMIMTQLPHLIRYKSNELEEHIDFVKKTILFWLEENPNDRR